MRIICKYVFFNVIYKEYLIKVYKDLTINGEIHVTLKDFLKINKGRINMKSNAYIISGFLGAGKTMLIEKIIKESLYNKDIVIIENEFGEVSIDVSILSKNEVKIKEISSGCICCSVAYDFVNAIKEVYEKFKPEIIIIEPSGVAKLSEILSLCKEEELHQIINVHSVITVVDAIKFKLYIDNFSEFYKNQIINAKTIVLSRTQNILKDQLKETVKTIKILNNKAEVFIKPWSEIKAERIIYLNNEEKDKIEPKKIELTKNKIITKGISLNGINTTRLKVKSKPNHKAKEVFQTFSIKNAPSYSENQLIKILVQLKDESKYGDILRAKGILITKEEEHIRFDYVLDEIKIEKIEDKNKGRLCIIGRNINKENLKKLFSYKE